MSSDDTDDDTDKTDEVREQLSDSDAMGATADSDDSAVLTLDGADNGAESEGDDNA